MGEKKLNAAQYASEFKKCPATLQGVSIKIIPNSKYKKADLPAAASYADAVRNVSKSLDKYRSMSIVAQAAVNNAIKEFAKIDN